MRSSTRTLGLALAAFEISLLGCASAPPTQTLAANAERTPDKNTSKAKYLPIPEEFDPVVHQAEVLGLSLYQRDRAAEKGTDALVASGQLKRPAGDAVGWLVSDLGDGNYRIKYIIAQAGALRSYAEVDYNVASDRASDPHAIDPSRPLDPSELAQARAIRTAQQGEFLRCVEKYNVVTIPSGSGDRASIHVYLIPSRDDAKVFPQGGFHDFTISADGASVQDHYSQTKACLNGRPSDTQGQLAALMNSHLTSPTPTAFHVFMNLNYRMNMFTVTVQNQMLWSISGGRIRLVSTDVGK